ncbi:hypothetical protein DV515_00011075 [Chloebia gouldiae]|uniref:Uncharacterized protein n=1 Tax=Chloebia gouldiae TaxID=44316 RepID=A0A3L8S781_CHLGU|nr:hypothetical protein DV515_00011075 [Chloebia gouldiae]
MVTGEESQQDFQEKCHWSGSHCCPVAPTQVRGSRIYIPAGLATLWSEPSVLQWGRGLFSQGWDTAPAHPSAAPGRLFLSGGHSATSYTHHL